MGSRFKDTSLTISTRIARLFIFLHARWKLGVFAGKSVYSSGVVWAAEDGRDVDAVPFEARAPSEPYDRTMPRASW